MRLLLSIVTVAVICLDGIAHAASVTNTDVQFTQQPLLTTALALEVCL